MEFAKTYIVPLVILAGWYLLAGALGAVAGNRSRIEAWCAANPKLALLVNLLRASGLDWIKIVASLRDFARSKAGLPPATALLPVLGVLVGLGATALCGGCAGTFEEAKLASRQVRTATPPIAASSPVRCQSLSEREYWFTGLGVASGAIGAAAGGMTLPIENKTIDTVLIVTTVAGGVGAGAFGWLGSNAGSTYVREGCGQ